MDSVVRGVVVYLVLLLVFRVSGKRSLAQITTFDFVLLLIVAEAVQQALLGDDNSMTNSLLVVLTLAGIDISFSLLKQRSRTLEKLIDDVPLVLVEDGKPLPERLRKSRVDESDILASARMGQGLERMEQIKYAVLERSGGISIVPQPTEPS
jgi:uncharacterized membrane protein YcaP (DUF421 family)